MSEMPTFPSLSDAFAYYTECALATVEMLDGSKASSKSAKRRAHNIAEGMVAACLRHGVPVPGPFARCPRLRERMTKQED